MVGDPDLWPAYGGDLNVIRSSTVDFGSIYPDDEGVATQTPMMGQSIHFPPARDELWPDLVEDASFSDRFKLVNGTFRLGTLTKPPDGVCTPHLVIIDGAELHHVIDAVTEVNRLYDAIYNAGDEIITEQPL